MKKSVITISLLVSSVAQAGIDLNCYDTYFNEVRRLDAEQVKAQKLADRASGSISKNSVIGGIIGGVAGAAGTVVLVRSLPRDPSGDTSAKTMVGMLGGLMLVSTGAGAGAWIGEKATKDLSRKQREIKAAGEASARHQSMLSAMKVLRSADAIVNRRDELTVIQLLQHAEILSAFAGSVGNSDNDAVANKILKGDASGALCRDNVTLNYEALVSWVRAN